MGLITLAFGAPTLLYAAYQRDPLRTSIIAGPILIAILSVSEIYPL